MLRMQQNNWHNKEIEIHRGGGDCDSQHEKRAADMNIGQLPAAQAEKVKMCEG
jgi:hypothetical protein